MNFEAYVLQEIESHPSLQPVDIVKLCYQAAFGAEHLLSDLDAARHYLEREFADTASSDVPLFERISDDVCRVNLGGFKARSLPVEWLFKMFAASSCINTDGDRLFEEYLSAAECVISKREIFPLSLWQKFLCKYRNGGGAVHHSSEYRQNEKPAYRIINSRFLRLFPILESISQAKRTVIAIDGRAASGKTTMAHQLADIINASVIHTDDFFLPTDKRTKQRLDTPGGNIHYERFKEEVLPFLSSHDSFSYRVFDCSVMAFNGVRDVEKAPFYIVEGAYSLHPEFGSYADITVFSDIDAHEQMQRILLRNGEDTAVMFRERWIPLEEKYFEHYSVVSNAQIRV